MFVRLYEPKDRILWNTFVKESRNSHFMFIREYMEYHADRFKDFSLIFSNDRGDLVAVLPANLAEADRVVSHQGLTFGGLLLDNRCTGENVLEIFSALKVFLSEKQISKFVYKCIPYIYFSQPSDEDRYALFVNNARLIRRDISSSIFLDNRGSYTKGRKWTINKARKAGLVVSRSSDWAAFWNVLETALQSQHQVAPVHSLEDITSLAAQFPDSIKLFVAEKDGRIIAGTVIYENKQVVHTQYMANSLEGRDLGALDFVIDRLISEEFAAKKYFDFGISNENNGLFLNSGLIAQKEGFGARGVVHDFYEMVIK